MVAVCTAVVVSGRLHDRCGSASWHGPTRWPKAPGPLIASTIIARPDPPNALIARLAVALDERGVSYCHWKSNAAIARSESGLNDLDLLVARDHAAPFREALSGLGFARVERQGKPIPPGKEDYFGYDAASGTFVHVDAHYQLVLGHDRTKNYRIPLERAFLESAQRRGVFRLPTLELEYLVFLTRMVLKYAVWDEVVWRSLRGQRARLKASEREELVFLESSVDPSLVAAAVRHHAAWLGDGLLEACRSVALGEVSLAQRLRIGRRLHRRLAAHAQRNEATDGVLRLARRVVMALQRQIGLLPRFRLASGGAMIAVLGGDGSGKSTAVEELGNWLGGEFDVRRIHLGKPRWSATTYGIRAAFKVARVSRDAMRRTEPDQTFGAVESEGGYRAMAWLVCTARDRYLTYRKARRFANRGGIVVSDRYPHPALTSMDVPLIGQLGGSRPAGRLAETLQSIERGYHDRIEPPEFVAVLRVDPDTAARRKTDEPAEYVKRRVAEIWKIDWEAASVSVIDARRPPEEVAAELKSLIWDALA